MRASSPEKRTVGRVRAPHLNLVTDRRSVRQATVENVLRLLLDVMGLLLKDTL